MGSTCTEWTGDLGGHRGAAADFTDPLDRHEPDGVLYCFGRRSRNQAGRATGDSFAAIEQQSNHFSLAEGGGFTQGQQLTKRPNWPLRVMWLTP